MLEFLFGGPGSGKTDYILNEIKQSVSEGKKTYLLVPEQQLFISECMLADLPPSSALCFEVISFSRLCEIAFSKFGGITTNAAGSGIRNVLMWHSLRELSTSLSQYKGIKVDSAFTSMMLSAVDELHANGISAEQCESAASKATDPILSRKLSDLAAIYQNFHRNIDCRLENGALAAEDKLFRLANLLEKHKFLSDCRIYIDSFTSFTGEEYAVIEAMIAHADKVCISFPYFRGSHAPHTYTLSNTVKKLTKFTKDMGIETKDVCLSQSKRCKNAEIREIEKSLWDFSITKDSLPFIPENDRGCVEMTECANEYEEIWLAALNILKLHKNGVPYSEIALIMRDCESKKGLIEAIFEAADIPYFYSQRTDISATASSRLILSALRCIIYNFNASDVLTLIKTGLLDVDSHDADLFEDYVYTWDINGKLFTADAWSMNPDGYTTLVSDRGKEILEAANRVRSIIIPPLLDLKRDIAIANGDTVECCRALYAYLESISLSKTLSASAELSLAGGNVKEAGELLRVYDFIVSAITDICTVMGNVSITAEDLAAMLEITFKNTDIGSVPAVNDYVTVGSAATLRVENISAAILIGLCEGEFPANFSDGVILSENDKIAMEEIGLSLTSREETITSDELFYAWRAMTKPSQKLFLSTCLSSISGRALNPSSAWNRVRFLFPYISVNEFDLNKIRNICSAGESDLKDEEASIENDASALENESEVVNIDPLFVRMIFGDKLYLSKSRISTFAQCPYRYWCEYILKLREQKKSVIGYADSGTVIHYVLEKLLKKLKTDDGTVCQIEETALIDLVDDILNEYIHDINCPLPPRLMYNFSRLRDLSLVMCKSVLDEFAHSDFKIVAMEQSISDREENAFKPMEIRIGDAEDAPIVSLGGIIDRIDLYDGDDRRYVRIVDYKSGSHKYNVDKISSGEDLQLPAYLFTASLEENKDFFGGDESKELFPASALFLSAEESGGVITPIRSGFILNSDELLHAASADMDSKILAGISFNKDGSLSKRSSNAAVSEEGIGQIRTALTDTVAETAGNMYSGYAPRTPSKEACGFCSLKSTCPVANKDS